MAKPINEEKILQMAPKFTPEQESAFVTEIEKALALPEEEERRISIYAKPGEGLPAAIADYAVLHHDPADLIEVVRENLAGQKLRVFDMNVVKVPGGGGRSWDINTLEGPRSMEVLEGVIVTWADKRAWWETTYDQGGGGTPPDCRSEDGLTGVGNPGGLCAKCPHAQWGSKRKFNYQTSQMETGRGQDCSSIRLLFMLQKDDLLPIVIKGPATSIKPLQTYSLRLTEKGIGLHRCITALRLNPTMNADNQRYSEIVPTMVARLNVDEIAHLSSYLKILQPLLKSAQAGEEDFQE